ncbi:hypothetical protein GCM10007385_16710 [Tateyamaria omphalii]|nr:hypothetical protein GCM10007385_16710 [Tateyamaria omphalii]
MVHAVIGAVSGCGIALLIAHSSFAQWAWYPIVPFWQVDTLARARSFCRAYVSSGAVVATNSGEIWAKKLQLLGISER